MDATVITARKAQKGNSPLFIGAAMFIAAFLALFSRSIFMPKAELLFIAEANRFIQRSESFTVIVAVDSRLPVNAVETRITFPGGLLRVIDVSRRGSALELWVKEPTFSNDEGFVEFAGGAIRAFTGRAVLARITFKPLKTGTAHIEFGDSTVLAADGRGSEILGKREEIDYVIREDDLPSADVNDDNTVTFRDVSKILAHTGSDNMAYDLNGDGEVSLADVRIVLSKMFK